MAAKGLGADTTLASHSPSPVSKKAESLKDTGLTQPALGAEATSCAITLQARPGCWRNQPGFRW